MTIIATNDDEESENQKYTFMDREIIVNGLSSYSPTIPSSRKRGYK